MVYGKAAPPPPNPGEEGAEGEEDSLFRRRPGGGASPGPKREPGEGFTQDIPKTSMGLRCLNVQNYLQNANWIPLLITP